jgi:6-phosphogluconolactonase/glucosamine-6-phosphate isomerase/deaminase
MENMKAQNNVIDAATDYIFRQISSQLEAGKSVLWLVPGGSSIEVALLVAKTLAGHDLSKLTMTLTDERYGPVGHADSNWRQLSDSGFALPGATLHPVLTDLPMDETVQHFGEIIRSAFSEADYSIGFFGIGPDGHTAGMLPGSPAATATTTTSGYDAEKFLRITITKSVIAKLDEAVVYAVGENKWPIVNALNDTITSEDWPALSLRTAGKLTIFSDLHTEQ